MSALIVCLAGGRVASATCARRGQISDSLTREPNTEELVSNLSGLLSTVWLSATLRARVDSFRQFGAQFYGSAQLSLISATLNCILLFISYLSFRKLSFSTFTSYLSAIFYGHKLIQQINAIDILL